MPLPRMTTRRWMIVVAMTSLVFAVGISYERSREFAARARKHEVYGALSSSSDLVRYHYIMAEKYWRAARSPWVPVEPDPPEPK